MFGTKGLESGVRRCQLGTASPRVWKKRNAFSLGFPPQDSRLSAWSKNDAKKHQQPQGFPQLSWANFHNGFHRICFCHHNKVRAGRALRWAPFSQDKNMHFYLPVDLLLFVYDYHNVHAISESNQEEVGMPASR